MYKILGLSLFILFISACRKIIIAKDRWRAYRVKPGRHDAALGLHFTRAETLGYEVVFPSDASSAYAFKNDSSYQDSWNKLPGFWQSPKLHNCFTWRWLHGRVEIGCHTHTRKPKTSIYRLMTPIDTGHKYLFLINRSGTDVIFRIFEKENVLLAEERLPIIQNMPKVTGISEVWFGGKYGNPANHDLLINIKFLWK